MPDNSLPNMKIQSKTIYHLPFTINEASPRRRVVLNLGHLYFDIVSTVRCPVEDFVLRISYFASLHILMPANPKSEDVRILTYEIINLFMQNEPNFRKSQMNVNKVLAMDYEQMDTWSIRKTKPIKANSKPIQSQSKPIKANKMPKQTQFKPKQTQFHPQSLPIWLGGGKLKKQNWRILCEK